jgi:hypothetical protein
MVGIGGEKLWWCPSRDPNFGELSVTDLSGNGRHGVFQSMGSSAWITDTLFSGSRAISLDGIANFISSSYARPSITQFSISIWVKRPSNAFLDFHDLPNTGRAFGFGFYPFAAYCELGVGSQYSQIIITDTNTWRHYCWIYDGTKSSNSDRYLLFVDGTQRTITFPTPTSSSVGASVQGFRLGRSYITTSQYSKIIFDDARLFERAITPAEVIALSTRRAYEPLVAVNIFTSAHLAVLGV